MFTGIIDVCGEIVEAEDIDLGRRLRIRYPAQGRLQAVQPGDSVAVSGVCLTARQIGEGDFQADLSDTTLARTTLGQLKIGDAVNLEPALRVGDPLGGHLVNGHVDAVGEIVSAEFQGDCCHLEISTPPEIRRYLAERGSLCVDGVSLTLTMVQNDQAGMTLVPHTRAITLAGGYQPGQKVNLEVDILARYLERLLEERD